MRAEDFAHQSKFSWVAGNAGQGESDNDAGDPLRTATVRWDTLVRDQASLRFPRQSL